jgi:hypothetical protein
MAGDDPDVLVEPTIRLPALRIQSAGGDGAALTPGGVQCETSTRRFFLRAAPIAPRQPAPHPTGLRCPLLRGGLRKGCARVRLRGVLATPVSGPEVVSYGAFG